MLPRLAFAWLIRCRAYGQSTAAAPDHCSNRSIFPGHMARSLKPRVSEEEGRAAGSPRAEQP